MKLTDIWIYPIKSLGGIRMEHAEVLEKGLRYDRRYMLVDENNKFITQRAVPTLALFKLYFHESGFLISYQSESLIIPFEPLQKKEATPAIIWNDNVMVHELGDQINDWFTAQLKTKCKLVFFPESHKRDIDKEFAHNNEQVSLADGYPFLIIGKASLDDLNNRLKDAVPMNRFRPNFVFEGGKPFEEDSWKNFSIGSINFSGIKPCARCTITTVDQETAKTGSEPLATLSKFRKKESKVNFGQNLIATTLGEVKIGDEIKIESFHS